MILPKKLYYVILTGRKTRVDGRLPYMKKGGGKYSNLKSAQTQVKHLDTHYGIEAKVFVTQELEWTEVED